MSSILHLIFYLELLEKLNHLGNPWIITDVDYTASADGYRESNDGHNLNNYIVSVEIHVFLSMQYIPMSKNDAIS